MGLKELSLFTGMGGGVLGTQLLGFEPIGYVEINKYCQKVISQRIKDGFLHAAPIFTDVHKFLQSGAAREYRGFTDVVTGGFPCQPFSAAGKKLGEEDKRNLWKPTMEVISEVNPRWVFLENVPGLLSSGYFSTILEDLSEGGYDVAWRVLSANEMGAPHWRKRLWIVAHADSGRCEQSNEEQWAIPVPNSVGSAELGRWWKDEPELGRVGDGFADWMDRIRSIGNGQVPICAAVAFLLLAGSESE